LMILLLPPLPTLQPQQPWLAMIPRKTRNRTITNNEL
jgi:hypothetical protein